ncbi:MAG: lipoyl(octanoyl) transferase, partial [Dechloromonas sp.]|nr:lipoyl(octanoyl) transferase [Dechloromonas sp.]
MEVRRLGRVDYEPTWRAMREFTAARTPDTPDELWVVEHPPVFTLGQAGKP